MSKKIRKTPIISVEPKKDTSPYVFQREKIKFDLKVSELPWTEKQKEFIQLAAAKDTKIIICKGPAGSAKTILSVYAALKALSERKVGEIFYIRQPCESSSFNLGFLKGTQEEKMAPYLMPLRQKMAELLSPTDILKLEKDNRIKGETIGFLRGASISNSTILCDEIQNFTTHDFLLVMTRLGKFSKLIMTGDMKQSDIKGNGFEKIYNLFDNEESKAKGIKTFRFGKEDIMRNDVISYIIEKFEDLESKQEYRPSDSKKQ